jgi:hypothetical protein
MEHLAELLAQLDNLAELDDAALATLETELAAALDELLPDGTTPSDDALDQAEAITAGVEAIRTEQASRDEAATAREERAAALRDRVRADAEGDEGEPAEGEGDPTAEEGEGEPAEPPVAEPIAASTRTPAPRIGRVAARRQPTPPVTAAASPPMSFPEWGLTAAANAPSVTAGSPITDYDQLSGLFHAAHRMITGPNVGPRAYVPLVRAGRGAIGEYGEERFLDGHAATNSAKVRNVVHPQAITASGGMCAPINVAYDLPVVGSNARPVRDTALARFGADRGGVRTLVPPILTDVGGALGVWTNQNDIDAGLAGAPDPVKPCLVVDCPDEVETILAAYTECFRVGNFRQRFFPEQIEAVMKLIATAGARAGEIALLQTMKANSTAVTAAQLLGTTRDVLPYLDQAVAAYRDRWRLADTERLRLVLPRWVSSAMRADMARSLPGTSDENLVIADATIAAWFSSRSVNVTWAMEASTAAGFFGAQVAGVLTKWPAAIEAFLFPEGAFLFLDGGSLDLGLIRDSTLTATNDLMFFSETFEGCHFQGPESLMLTITTCPDGTVSGTADVNPCA